MPKLALIFGLNNLFDLCILLNYNEKTKELMILYTYELQDNNGSSKSKKSKKIILEFDEGNINPKNEF